jgi:hypothetical protein
MSKHLIPPSRKEAGSSDEAAFLVDLRTGKAAPLDDITLASVGLRERADLQRWISEQPQIVGPGLLLVTTEFDQWEIRDQKVPDRLDVLFLDQDGSPLVAELKRDKAADTTELQALKYAAYCSQLTVDELVDEYSRYQEIDPDEARAALLNHAPSLTEGELGPVRIRLVAGSFGPAVTSVVLWLRDHDIDIGCVEVTARQVNADSALLSSRSIIPLPEAEDYLVRRRRKEQKEEERKTRQRRSETSVALLIRAGAVKPGDELKLKVDQFTKALQPKIEELLEQDPAAGTAEWTGNPQKALKWLSNDELYSPTGLVNAILARIGVELTTIPGPDYWLLPTGRSMYEESKSIDDQSAQRKQRTDT